MKLVLAGHNHYYARCKVDGITYITTGGGGTTLRTPTTEGPHLLTARKSHHFLRIEIKDKALQMAVIQKEGRIIETVDLQLLK